MRFDCGLTRAEARKALAEALKPWRDWYAWYPVKVGYRDCRWLEVVQRRGYLSIYDRGIIWEYKEEQ